VEEQDLFAYKSQEKATKAQADGKFIDEIVDVIIPRRKKEPLIFNKDEYIRTDSSVEKLKAMRSAFKKDGSVTAGNASGINDGASAFIIASEKALKKYNLTAIAEIVAYGAHGNSF